MRTDRTNRAIMATDTHHLQYSKNAVRVEKYIPGGSVIRKRFKFEPGNLYSFGSALDRAQAWMLAQTKIIH